MFNSVGVETKTGSRVVVRTKHTDQVANVLLQTQIPDQLLAEIPPETHHQWTGGLAQGSETQQPGKKDKLAVHHVHIQTPSQLSEEAAPRSHAPLHQSVATIQLQSHTPALGVTPALEHLSAPKQQSAAGANDPHPEGGEENSCVSQSHTSTARTAVQPNSSQSAAASPRPPVLSSGEIHSKAQSMARGRLEKAKRHLQGRIQQAISLFGSGEISGPQVKRKQVVFRFIQFDRTVQVYMQILQISSCKTCKCCTCSQKKITHSRAKIWKKLT